MENRAVLNRNSLSHQHVDLSSELEMANWSQVIDVKIIKIFEKNGVQALEGASFYHVMRSSRVRNPCF